MLGFQANRQWVYPQYVTGRFQRIHRWTGRALMAFLVVVPWIPVRGHPAVRIDLPARQLYALGVLFTPSDGFLLTLMGLFAAFSLFFFTSLFGRLWCGYACPQTVFLEELVRPIERLTEGDRGVRMKRDAGPWTAERVARKAAKLGLFAALAIVVSMSFMAWFAGARELWTGQAGTVSYGLVGAFATGWFADWAWFREQLCNFLCPYARFQGALTDEESQVVAYDRVRGEPRGGKAAKLTGACVDCGKCAAVCPQGIDIRDGFQLECINCARCVDACEGVMGKLEHPSLISYATLAEVDGKQPRVLRARTLAYGGLLAIVGTALAAMILTHAPIEAMVDRSTGSLYTVDSDGWLRNTFMVRVTNRDGDSTPDTFTVDVEGLDGAEVIMAPLVLEAAESRVVPLIVRVPPDANLPRTVPIRVHVRTDRAGIVRSTTFKTDGGS
jgi:cytochrome c oxidase accessory protein FixG